MEKLKIFQKMPFQQPPQQPRGAYLDVEVECKVEIRYTGPAIYSWRSDSSSQDESHSLYAHGSESDSFTFDFSFSSYNEVTQVKVDSANCEIESVNLW